MSSRDDGARDERAERAQAEEQAWREIVDHYGDLPAVLDEPEAGTLRSGPEPTPDPVERFPIEPPPRAADVFHFEPYDEQFVPPPLPPPPDIATDRRFAWIGLVAPPVLLLVVMVLDYPLPSILTGALVIAFLASFGYLVATMSRDPRDPDDDGARL